MSSQSTADGNVSLTRHLRGRHRHRQGAGAGAEPRQRRGAPPARRGAPQRPHRAQALARPAAGDPPDLARTTPTTQVYISNYGLLNVRDKLMRLYGVGDVSLFGAREYSMRVWLDPERIALRGLTAERGDGRRCARRTCRWRAARSASRRSTRDNAFQVSLQMKGRLRTADEFEDIIVKIGADGRVVRVKDIARVELGALSYPANGYADRYPGRDHRRRPAAGLQRRGRHPTASRTPWRRWPRASPRASSTASSTIPTEFIEVSIKKLYITILEATSLVVLVVLLFLQDLARDAHSARRHPGVADRHLRRHAGVRLLDQHADAVRAGAVGRHRGRRRHRRGRERRAQADGGPVAACEAAQRVHGRGRHRADRHRAGAARGVHSDRPSSAASPACSTASSR